MIYLEQNINFNEFTNKEAKQALTNAGILNFGIDDIIYFNEECVVVYYDYTDSIKHITFKQA
jgi:hypothetical protein